MLETTVRFLPLKVVVKIELKKMPPFKKIFKYGIKEALFFILGEILTYRVPIAIFLNCWLHDQQDNARSIQVSHLPGTA